MDRTHKLHACKFNICAVKLSGTSVPYDDLYTTMIDVNMFRMVVLKTVVTCVTGTPCSDITWASRTLRIPETLRFFVNTLAMIMITRLCRVHSQSMWIIIQKESHIIMQMKHYKNEFSVNFKIINSIGSLHTGRDIVPYNGDCTTDGTIHVHII